MLMHFRALAGGSFETAQSENSILIGTYTGTNTATIGPHQVGDYFVGYATRDGGSAAPAYPEDWTLIASGGSNALGYVAAYKLADSTSEISGTWTNATSLIIVHERPASGQSVSMGAVAHNISGASVSPSVPALTLQNSDNTSRVIAFYASAAADIVNLTSAPSGMELCDYVQDATDTAAAYRTTSTVSSWASAATSFSGTSGAVRMTALEVKLTEGVPVELPTGLGATVLGDQITLSWTDTNAGQAQTLIETSANGTSGWSTVTTKTVGVTSHVIAGLSAGTYYYRIRAIIGSSYSSYTSAVSGTVSITVNTPTSPAASASGASITVSWTDANSGAAQHSIERSPNGSTGWAEITVVAAGTNSYINSDLSSGTYYYRIRALISSTYSSYTSTVNATATGGTISLPAADLVIENFETSDLTAAGTDCDFNSGNLFTWDGTYYTSIVGMVSGVATRFIPLPEVTYPGKDYTPKQGSRCLRFRYAPDIGMSEQRFSLGAHYDDVWVRYWVKIPENFSHGTMNNKWAAFWTNSYDGAGDVTFQTRPTSGGSCKMVVQDGGVAVVEVDVYENFINVATDLGRWMQIVYHLRPESSNGAANGQIRVWRRWDGENSWTQIYNKTNAGFYEGGVGVHQGYLFGSSEGGPYQDPDETHFLIDTFEVSTTSLV